MPARWAGIVVALLALMVLAMPAASSVSNQRQTEGTVVIDGLMWAVENNGQDVNWNTAAQYCSDFRLGGHADWRLPTIDELESVYDPSISSDYRIKSPIQLTSCCLWSSTLLEDDGDQRRALDPSRYAWGFYFANGDRYYSAMNFTDGRALCVRAAGE